jgi:hypothetical protein
VSNILRQRLEAGQTGNAEHPAPDLLAAFVEHGLKNGERNRVLAHLAICSTCRQAVVLAAPEVTEALPVVHGGRPILQFPGAMRWASLAAALAVAVGVGVISYEHETGRHGSQSIVTFSQPEARERQPQKAVSEPAAPALQDNIAANQAVIESKKAITADKKIIPSMAAKKANDRLNLDETALARNKKRSAPPDVVAGVVNEQAAGGVSGGIVGGEAFQRQVPVTGADLALTPADKESAVSQNEIQAKSAPAPVAAAAPVPPMASSVYADQRAQEVTSAGPASQGRDTDAFVTRNQVVSNEPLTARAENMLAVPPKTAGLSAVGGAAFRRPAAAMTEMVSWTVTAAGKLQRQLRNGAVKLIEPAPGLMVRAVAAHGIEVWAGGSQPDLSARQWQQTPALFHSSDAGESWTQVSGPWHGSIHQLSLAGTANLTVVTDDGTWISRDAGKNWSRP